MVSKYIHICKGHMCPSLVDSVEQMPGYTTFYWSKSDYQGCNVVHACHGENLKRNCVVLIGQPVNICSF